jgi:hypothetical protein
MTNLSDLQLEQACHSELALMVRLQLAKIESIENENQHRREEIERLKRPKPNPRNSSQRPLRDQNSNSSSDQPKKNHGPPSADLTLNDYHCRVSQIGNRLVRLLGDLMSDSEEI